MKIAEQRLRSRESYERRRPYYEQRYAEKKEEILAYSYQRYHGESIERKKSRLEEQGNKCANAACGTQLTMTTGQQDHDHETGRPRGILCKKCNVSLGNLKDDLKVIQGLVEYLKRYS